MRALAVRPAMARDDDGREAVEDAWDEDAPDSRCERGHDDGARDDDGAHEQYRLRDLLHVAVHLGEDDRQRRGAAEDEQADLDNAGDAGERACEDDGGEDTVEQG